MTIRRMTELAKEKYELGHSLDWLFSYINMSSTMNKRYLKPAEAIKILGPILSIAPYVPLNEPLYRVMDTGHTKRFIGAKIDLKANKVTSFTSASSTKTLKRIAEAIGADNAEYCYVTRVQGKIFELSNWKWLNEVVLPALKPFRRDYTREIADLKEVVRGYLYQQEVLGFSASPITTVIVADISSKENYY
jgi:hypothetical protein